MAGKKSKKNPDGQIITRQLPFTLTDEEIASRATTAAKVNKELSEVIVKKKLAMDEFSGKIKDKSARVNELLTQINTGMERREVECVEHKNFEQNIVEFWWEGQMLESREMTIKDRQVDMEDITKGKKAKTKTRKKASKEEPVVEKDPGFSGVYEESASESQPVA